VNAPEPRLERLVRDRWDSILDQVATALSRGARLDEVGCTLDAAEGGFTAVIPFGLVRCLAHAGGPEAARWADETPASTASLRILAIFPDGSVSVTTCTLDLPKRFLLPRGVNCPGGAS
jgi:hypothetical protein